MNIPAILLIVSVICMPPACLAAQLGDRLGESVRPSIIFVDDEDQMIGQFGEYVIDLKPLAPNASYDACVRYSSEQCEKYASPDNNMCTIQYSNVCMDRLAACQAEGRTDCEGAQ